MLMAVKLVLKHAGNWKRPTKRKLVLFPSKEHYEVQILIGFNTDTVSLEDNTSFVPTKSENLVSKGGKPD